NPGQLGAVLGEILAGPETAAGVRSGFGAQAPVVRHAEHLAALAGEEDGIRTEGGRRVQVVAWTVDEQHRPAQRAVGVEHEEPALARAYVDVAVAVDRGRRADRIAGIELPAQRAGARVEAVHRAIGRRLHDGPVGELTRAGVDVITRAEGPARHTAPLVVAAQE